MFEDFIIMSTKDLYFCKVAKARIARSGTMGNSVREYIIDQSTVRYVWAYRKGNESDCYFKEVFTSASIPYYTDVRGDRFESVYEYVIIPFYTSRVSKDELMEFVVNYNKDYSPIYNLNEDRSR